MMSSELCLVAPRWSCCDFLQISSWSVVSSSSIDGRCGTVARWSCLKLVRISWWWLLLILLLSNRCLIHRCDASFVPNIFAPQNALAAVLIFQRRSTYFSNIWTGWSKYFGGPNIMWQCYCTLSMLYEHACILLIDDHAYQPHYPMIVPYSIYVTVLDLSMLCEDTCIGYITRWRSLRNLHTEGWRPEAKLCRDRTEWCN